METIASIFIVFILSVIAGELSGIKNAIKDNTKAIREKDQ